MLKKAIAIWFAVILALSGCLYAFPGRVVKAESGNTTPSGIPLSGLEAFVDQYVDAYIGKSTVGAAIVVVKDHEVVLSKGYGYADVQNQVPINPEKTVFEWGSISKLAVWTAVMQLAENNQLDLQADIRTYLPNDFLSKLNYDEPITMLNLMNHNAGFEEYMFDMAYQSPGDVRSLEEGLKLAEPAQVRKPGETVAYSNYGTSLAGYIVERITGQKFHEYVDEHIFSKLSMNQSTAHPTLENRPDLIANKAQGYLYTGLSSFTPASWNYMSMYPNGGNNGTAADMAKFALAFMPQAGKQSPLFVQPATISEMLSTSYAADKDMPGIAHGFWEYAGAHKGVGHGGNTIAFSSNLQLVPEEQFAVVILTNQSAESPIVHGLMKELLGQRSYPESVEEMPDPQELEGSYVTARRPYEGFMNVYAYLTLLKVIPLESNEIRVSLAGMSADYKQVKPYLYEKVRGDSSLDVFMQLHFKVTDHAVDKITAYTTEYLPLPKFKSTALLAGYAALAAVSVLYFAMAPIVMLIQSLLFRKKNRLKSREQALFGKIVKGLTLVGTGLIANNLILALRMLSNYERAYSEIVVHIIMNDVFTVLAVLLTGLLLIYWYKKHPNLTFKEAAFAWLSVILLAVLIALLVIWQFYR
ncbi:serine hydrolase domain-containing protein [Paenibacillus sp. 2TAB23]|uniref:serine hydrolase domain-containing protein n=1 Tax=Paenibacillus sp. 2TAB23 TaxID=3233004 RepID=UPI003F9D9EEA